MRRRAFAFGASLWRGARVTLGAWGASHTRLNGSQWRGRVAAVFGMDKNSTTARGIELCDTGTEVAPARCSARPVVVHPSNVR
eukprot:scaffold385_cov305-Pinguiococcus_pyrenoidosus.AAC.28